VVLPEQSLAAFTLSVGTCAALQASVQRATFHLPRRSGFKTGRGAEQFDAPVLSVKASSRVFLLVLLGLLCATASLRAEGPVLTLAMVNYDSLASRQARAIRNSLVTKVDRPVSLTPEELAPDGILSFLAEKVALPTTTFLQTRPLSEAPNPLLLTLKNYGEDGRYHVWASLTAGYGQIFLYKSVTIYGRNGSCWEEPSCGFFKFSFNF
jgi:hypothetical protein